jgi:hypothetical protein
MGESENLDIPAWVQQAWSRPLKKGDVLFRSVNSTEGSEDDWEMNAWIGGASDYAYAEGYRLAGRIVADHVIQNRWDADFLVYPIVFLYRHNVELQLKRLIPTGAALTDTALDEIDTQLLQQSHDLSRLWAVFEPILRETSQGVGVTGVEIEAIASYVRQLHKIDQGSYSFRYMATKAGTPSIDRQKLPHINIGELAECMEKLTAYLFGLGEAFRDAFQVKCEMEDEARSESVEYYEGE